MISNFKPYPEYKESGLPWLGRVPGHWDARRMKFLFQERSQKGFPNEPLLAATQSKGVVRKEDYEQRTVTATSGLENLKLVEVGDFVISLRSFQGGIEVSHARGIISPAYTVLKPHGDFEPRYFEFYFKSADFVKSMTLFVTGIREGQNIDYERLKRALMPLPPPDEQAAIVRFLDSADARLERAIRAKRKVIALLNEQRQAVIHRAVTRGLDDSVTFKPSGIPWIGDIPKHWEVRKIKQIASAFFSGGTPDSGNSKYYTDDQSAMPWLLIADITRQRRVADSANRVTEVGMAARNLQILPKGTVVMAMYASIGTVAILDIEATVNQAIIGIQPRLETSSAEWLLVSLESMRPDLIRETNSSTQANLNAWKVRNLSIPLPPPNEQAAIVAFLDGGSERINRVISRLEREIELLREYRTRLVADVVTGKVDVREAAAQLPDETPPASEQDENESDNGDFAV